MKVANPVDKVMLARIKKHGDGWVFSANDFLDLGSRSSIDLALSRLTLDKTIRRLARGLYDIPRQHQVVGEIPPNLDMIALALAGKSGARIQPTGAYAANLLGLSEQVPSKIVYLTTGRSKHIRLAKLDITLKQTSPKVMATAGRISGLVIQALRYIGKDNITQETIKRLERRLSPSDKALILADAVYAPAWITAILKRLAGHS